LPEDKATIALNVDASRDGALTPLKSFVNVKTDFPGSQYKTLFKYKTTAESSATTWWIASNQDVDFCKAQIVDDDYGWIYYVDNDNADNGSYYPLYDYSENQGGGVKSNDVTYTGNFFIMGIDGRHSLGVPAPQVKPTPQYTAPAEVDGLSQEFRSYVYTYVYKDGGREMESAPSPATESVGVYLTDNTSVTVEFTGKGTGAPPFPSDYGATQNAPVGMDVANLYIRVYRSVGGGFFLVNTGGDIPYNSGSSYTDTTAAADLGEELPSLTWGLPPKNLRGLTNMANGILAGFVGKTVYFCEPYIPHAWPINYAVTVDSPIVGMAALDTTLVVLTQERPYFVQGSSPEYMTVVAGGIEQGCSSKRSIAVLNGEVYYVSPDGLVAVSPRGARIITEQLFTRNQWNSYFTASSVHGYSHDLKYFGFHDNGSFIYDVPTKSFTTSTIKAEAAFQDLSVDRLYVMYTNNDIVAWGESSSNLQYTWKSKVFSMPSEVSFSCMQIEAETYPIDYTLTMTGSDGTTTQSGTVTSRDMLRIKSVLARDWQIEITGSGEVYNIALAQSGEELASV
jgi:hypothetical protein